MNESLRKNVPNNYQMDFSRNEGSSRRQVKSRTTKGFINLEAEELSKKYMEFGLSHLKVEDEKDGGNIFETLDSACLKVGDYLENLKLMADWSEVADMKKVAVLKRGNNIKKMINKGPIFQRNSQPRRSTIKMNNTFFNDNEIKENKNSFLKIKPQNNTSLSNQNIPDKKLQGIKSNLKLSKILNSNMRKIANTEGDIVRDHFHCPLNKSKIEGSESKTGKSLQRISNFENFKFKIPNKKLLLPPKYPNTSSKINLIDSNPSEKNILNREAKSYKNLISMPVNKSSRNNNQDIRKLFYPQNQERTDTRFNTFSSVFSQNSQSKFKLNNSHISILPNNKLKDFFLTCDESKDNCSKISSKIKKKVRELNKTLKIRNEKEKPSLMIRKKKYKIDSKEEINFLKSEKITISKNYVVTEDHTGRRKIISAGKDNIFRDINFINSITNNAAFKNKDALYRKFGHGLRDEEFDPLTKKEIEQKDRIAYNEHLRLLKPKQYKLNEIEIKKMLKTTTELKKKILKI
jgi:hypothetical protein